MKISELYRHETCEEGAQRDPFRFIPPDSTGECPPETAYSEIVDGRIPDPICVNCVTTFSLSTDRVDLIDLCARLPHVELDHDSAPRFFVR